MILKTVQPTLKHIFYALLNYNRSDMKNKIKYFINYSVTMVLAE